MHGESSERARYRGELMLDDELESRFSDGQAQHYEEPLHDGSGQQLWYEQLYE